jgi:hypothetical protein
MDKVTAFALQDNLVDSARSDRSLRRDGRLEAQPRLVEEFAGRWSLNLGPPYQSGGRCAWVAPSRDHAGRDLMLKVGCGTTRLPMKPTGCAPGPVSARCCRMTGVEPGRRD